MIRLLTIVAMIAAMGCTKRITSTNTVVTDSTYVKETIRFDTLHIPGDTVRIKERIECDPVTNTPKPFRIKDRTGRASATVEVKTDGTLSVTAVCDSLEKVIQAMDREIFRLRKEKKVVTITETPSKFKQWIDYTCRILALIFILFIGFQIIKHKVV